MALLITVAVFSVGSVEANEPSRSTDWEWVDYDGDDEVPDNVVTSRNGGEGDPICSAPVPGTSKYRVGWLNLRKSKCFIPGATQEEKRYAAIEGIRVLVHRQPDQQVFHFVPYDEWLAGPQTWPWNRAICASFPDGEKKVKVGSIDGGHRCISVGYGRKTHVLEKPDFMVLISEEAQDDSNEEAVDEAVAEALDNLGDALEDLFSTCDWDNARSWYNGNRKMENSLLSYKKKVKQSLKDVWTSVKEGKVREAHSALGKCAGSCTRLANSEGIAGNLGGFIADIEDNPCDDGGGDERQLELMESFRDLLTDACTAMDGEWKDYQTGWGTFIDRGSYGDFGLGRCESK